MYFIPREQIFDGKYSTENIIFRYHILEGKKYDKKSYSRGIAAIDWEYYREKFEI